MDEQKKSNLAHEHNEEPVKKKKKTFTNLSSRSVKNSLQLVQNSMANRFSHLRSESNSMGEERGSSSLCIWQRKREIEREREREV